jgi:alkylation response protein AidB-like acyl-CoA dehydrogenase
LATICCSSVIFAQSNDDSLTNLLVKRHIALNASKMTMPGYRVQVYYGSQRAKATEIRTEVLQKFPQTPAYIIYQQPNFKLRLGDFKTRLEAMKLLDEIKHEYAQAFIVKDEVKLPE